MRRYVPYAFEWPVNPSDVGMAVSMGRKSAMVSLIVRMIACPYDPNAGMLDMVRSDRVIARPSREQSPGPKCTQECVNGGQSRYRSVCAGSISCTSGSVGPGLDF